MKDLLFEILKNIDDKETWSELAPEIINRTSADDLIKAIQEASVKKHFKFLEVLTKALVDKYAKPDHEKFKEAFFTLTKQLITKIPPPYRARILVDKFLKFGGDAGELCSEMISKGIKLERSENGIILVHFLRMAEGDVNRVLTCFKRECSKERPKSKKINEFFKDCLKSLRIYKLDTLIGPWLRRKYYLKLVQQQRIENNIMIDGETGAGKTSLAKIIHMNSGRKGKFIKIDEKLSESEFNRKIKEAKEGTLFLDEVDKKVPKDLQENIFNDLPEKGIITATNRFNFSDLIDRRSIERYFIREFHRRIAGCPFTILPLNSRERQEDCMEAIEYFWMENTKYTEIEQQVVSPLAEKFEWPENYAQVRKVMTDIYKTKVKSNNDESKLTISNLKVHYKDIPEDTQKIIKRVFRF